MSIKMLGTEVAKKMKEDLIVEVLSLKEKGINPCLAIVRVGERPDDLSYERSAKKKMELLGIDCKIVELKENISQEQFEEEFKRVNDDENIHGILLFRPLPKHLKEDSIQKIMNPLKDVDCMTDSNLAKVLMGDKKGFFPCTAEAGIALLDYYDIPLEGKKVTILGRSLVVGKPIAMLFLARNATIKICHTHTINVKEEVLDADIVVAAVGKARMIKEDMVAENSIVLDVGINVDEDGNLCGDVDFSSLENKVSYISPVPKGVGSVTTSILAQHVIRSAKYLNQEE